MTAVTFDTCLLNLASFYKLKFKKVRFLNTSLQEVDFAETDLTLAVFENCDLARATFDNTLLEGADLRTAYNYAIDPARNKVKGARFTLPAVVGLLSAYDIEIT